jgi:hypothetical protein
MRVINLTKYRATPDQIEAGVLDVTDSLFGQLRVALTFDKPPTPDEIIKRSQAIVDVAREADNVNVMIGGDLWMIPIIERLLYTNGFSVWYPLSKIVFKHVTKHDGTIEKMMVFHHEGFVSGSLWRVINNSDC